MTKEEEEEWRNDGERIEGDTAARRKWFRGQRIREVERRRIKEKARGEGRRDEKGGRAGVPRVFKVEGQGHLDNMSGGLWDKKYNWKVIIYEWKIS